MSIHPNTHIGGEIRQRSVLFHGLFTHGASGLCGQLSGSSSSSESKSMGSCGRVPWDWEELGLEASVEGGSPPQSRLILES